VAIAVKPLHEIEAAYRRAVIYVYGQTEVKQDIHNDLLATYGAKRLRFFSHLDECCTEALDFAPKLIIFDVKTSSEALLRQLLRLKSARCLAHTALMVRCAYMSEQELGTLMHQGASEVQLAQAPKKRFLKSVSILMKGERDDKGLNLGNQALARTLEQRLPGLEGVKATPEVLSHFAHYYSLDLSTYVASPGTMSGDLSGVLPIDKHRFAVYCTDFCGHGLKAAHHTLRLMGLLHSDGFDRSDPGCTLSWLNERLKALLPLEHYAAMFYGVIDMQAQNLNYACASILPQLYRPAKYARWQSLCGSGLPLGFMSDVAFDVYSVEFARGAALCLYTDALVETPLPPQAVFTSESLLAAMDSLPDSFKTQDRIDYLLQKLDLKHNKLADDLSLLCLERL
jgi:phosphoserine phosphatase RsbU/P